MHVLHELDGIAFKIVKDQANADTIEAEFRMMLDVYAECARASTLFQIPKPLLFVNIQSSKTITSAGSPDHGRRRRRNSTLVSPETFKKLPNNNATYAMDRVAMLPHHISDWIVANRLPEHVRKNAGRINMCRLYFGRSASSHSPTKKFINTSNFILSRSDYEALASIDEFQLPSLRKCASEMGVIMATLHTSCFDGRDIEFVLAGKEDSKPAFYVIDFNQMRKFSMLDDPRKTASDCATSFFLNDPYFPRPRAPEVLWTVFKQGYAESITRNPVTGVWIEMKQEYFRLLEEEQAGKDAKAA